MSETALLYGVIVAALAFDFVNGWNDSANAIATVVSTRVLSPLRAVLFAAVLNFVGAFLSDKVAKTIGGGLVDAELVTPAVILSAMLAAAGWVGGCTYFGLPVSGSHSLIGGLVGAAIAAAGFSVIQVAGVTKVLIAMIASPLLGLIIGYIFLVGVYWIANSMSPRRVRQVFSPLQIVSSGYMALTHGMNDAQKVMGIITLALVTAGHQKSVSDGIPFWVILACATVMAIGTAAGGWKVIKTLGMNLAHIRPIEGFAAETAAGLVLTVAGGSGIPVSTTHTITGSILGVGTAYRARAVKWGLGQKILYAWVLTLPVTILVGAGAERVLALLLG